MTHYTSILDTIQILILTCGGPSSGQPPLQGQLSVKLDAPLLLLCQGGGWGGGGWGGGGGGGGGWGGVGWALGAQRESPSAAKGFWILKDMLHRSHLCLP